jgi:hypothetical protein
MTFVVMAAGKTTATARAGEGEAYIPTHRDKTAMDGAPDPLWLSKMAKSTDNSRSPSGMTRKKINHNGKTTAKYRDPSLRSG